MLSILINSVLVVFRYAMVEDFKIQLAELEKKVRFFVFHKIPSACFGNSFECDLKIGDQQIIFFIEFKALFDLHCIINCRPNNTHNFVLQYVVTDKWLLAKCAFVITTVIVVFFIHSFIPKIDVSIGKR